MGVIKRQGFKNLIVQYFGMVLGLVSVIFVYAQAKEQYGLFRVLFDASMILSPIVLLGANSVAIKFFPVYKSNKRTESAFLSYTFLWVVFGVLVFAIAFTPIKNFLLNSLYQDAGPLFREYAIYLFPITILLAFIRFFVQYTSNFQRVVVPVIFNQLFIKVGLPILILLFINEMITNEGIVIGIVVTYSLALLGVLIYLKVLGRLRFSMPFIKEIKKNIPQMSNYSGYSILTFLGAHLAFRLDSIMLGGLVSLASAGYYGILAVVLEIIGKPAKSIISVASPIISGHMESGRIEEVEKIYKSSSLNLLLFGFLIFFGLLLTIQSLLSIMPNTEPDIEAFYVAIALGIAHLINVGTSVNNEIINFSKFYRFSVVAILLLAILNITLNLLFIPKFGIIGAALATLVSISIFNISKVAFIWLKFKIQPFSKNTIYLLFIGLIYYFVVSFIPVLNNPILNILLKSSLYSLLYISTVFTLKISPDFNEMLIKLTTNYRDFLKL